MKLDSGGSDKIHAEICAVRDAINRIMLHRFSLLTPMQGKEIADASLAIFRATNRLETIADEGKW